MVTAFTAVPVIQICLGSDVLFYKSTKQFSVISYQFSVVPMITAVTAVPVIHIL